MKNRSILHIVSSMDPKLGGVCKAIRDIISGISLTYPDIINEVVSLDCPSDKFVIDDPFKIHALGKGFSPWNYSKSMFKWIFENSGKYDVIILHGLWSFQSFALYRSWRKKKVNYYVMPHGMLDPYFQTAPDRKFKAIRNNLIWRLIESKVVNNANGLLFTCEEERLLSQSSFRRYKPQREEVVGLGIQMPEVHSASHDLAFSSIVPLWNKLPHLLYLSRIHPKKGVDLLIEAYIKLESQGGCLPQLIVVGPGGNNPYGKKLRISAANSKNVIFQDILVGEAKWGAFYNCEAFVLPSHQENFGIAVVEALACRKPVLISDQVNIWREITDGGGGIAERDTLEGTYNLLKKWLKMNEEDKMKMALNARRVYENHFMAETAAKKMLDVFFKKRHR